MAGAARFRTLARAARIFALLCFLLPFATVSCSSRQLNDAFNNAMGTSSPSPVPRAAPVRCTLIQASGVQLASGSAELSRDCLAGAAAFLPAMGPRSLAGTPLARSDFMVIAAAALILLTLALGFALKGNALVFAGMAGNMVAILAVAYAVFVRVPQAFHAIPLPRLVPVTKAQLGRILEVGAGSGFLLMTFFLLLAIVLDVLALHASRAPPAAA